MVTCVGGSQISDGAACAQLTAMHTTAWQQPSCLHARGSDTPLSAPLFRAASQVHVTCNSLAPCHVQASHLATVKINAGVPTRPVWPAAKGGDACESRTKVFSFGLRLGQSLFESVPTARARNYQGSAMGSCAA